MANACCRWIGEVDEPRVTHHVYILPDGVHAVPPGQSLPEMLIAGALDSVYSPPRPTADWIAVAPHR